MRTPGVSVSHKFHLKGQTDPSSSITKVVDTMVSKDSAQFNKCFRQLHFKILRELEKHRANLYKDRSRRRRWPWIPLMHHACYRQDTRGWVEDSRGRRSHRRICGPSPVIIHSASAVRTSRVPGPSEALTATSNVGKIPVHVELCPYQKIRIIKQN